MLCRSDIDLDKVLLNTTHDPVIIISIHSKTYPQIMIFTLCYIIYKLHTVTLSDQLIKMAFMH